jgi:hypothetical protein
MRKYLFVIVAVVVVITAALYFYGRSEERQKAPGLEHATTTPGSAGGAVAPGGISGEVVETMDAGGYTYVRVKSGRDEVWAAGPETPVSVGDAVAMPAGMKMENFKSESLDRSFDAVYFVSEIRVGAEASAGGTRQMPPNHPPMQSVPEGMDLSGIEVPDGGTSIANLYSGRDDLEGKQVRVRGKVVKFTPSVMGKNWIHLRDGTGEEGTNDVTVTTDATVAVGDVVTAQGTVVLDKDFGYGYKYVVLVEDAKITP